MSTQQKPPSLSGLHKRAATVILGPELLDEAVALLEGATDLKDLLLAPDYVASHLAELLTSDYGPDNAADTVPRLREQAIEQARRDPDFLRVRPEDFLRLPGDRIPVEDKHLIWAFLVHFGHAVDHDFVYWHYHLDRSQHSFGQTVYEPAEMKDEFRALLDEKRPTWLKLARTKHDNAREEIQKRIGDPARPERMVMNLVRRRLSRLEAELGLYLGARAQQLKLERAQQQAADKEQSVDEAWDGFFVQDSAKPGLSAPDAPAPAAHPRGVAPDLGDSGLGG